MQARHPLFITFEGGEGAGKTTLIDKLEEQLGKLGRQVLRTREPGGTSFGECLRKILLNYDKNEPITSRAELLLFLAARAQHVEETIKPALESGKTVLCDRFNDSTLAYQGWARGFGLSFVQELCDFASAGLTPDLTFILDVDPEVGLERSRRASKEEAPSGQMDRIENEAYAFHQKVREGFHKLKELSPHRVWLLNANLPANEVFSAAWKPIAEKLG